MSGHFEVDEALKTFSGHAPLFPLPEGVLFPHLILPLHIYEERYRQMTADALDGDRLIAMALLKPGWELNYNSHSAAIWSTVCLGTIVTEERLDDGCYNLLLRGVCRAEVLAEQPEDHLYRVAQLLPVRDTYPVKPAGYWRECRKAVLSAFLNRFPRLAEDEDLQAVIRTDLCLGALCDLLCQSLDLSADEAAYALRELDVSRRCEWVLKQLLLDDDDDSLEEVRFEEFPPSFSPN